MRHFIPKMAEKIKTRFLVLSDTHAASPQPENSNKNSFREPLPFADVAIHTGDLTMTGKVGEHQAAFDLLRSLDAPLKIVIPGNHDLTLDRPYYDGHGHLWGPRPKYEAQVLDEIKDIYTGPLAISHGIHYLEEGTQTFRLANGAVLTVYASAYTPEFCQWAFAYPRSKDRYNSAEAENPVPTFKDATSATPTSEATAQGRNIDIMMTHGPPHTIRDETARQEQVGCRYLLTAVSRSKPLLHCFGHIHEGWGAIRKQWSEPESSYSESIKSPHEWESTQNPKEKWLCVDDEVAVNDMGVMLDATDLKRGQETLFVNASIMSMRYRPIQHPWVVDLLLDKAEGDQSETSLKQRNEVTRDGETKAQHNL